MAALAERRVEESPFAGLSIRGVGKSYGAIEVLADVNLDIRPGEVLALLGENGAGKSTLSAIIAGLVRPSTGSMSWEGRPYVPASPGDAISAGIGLIHQELRLLPHLSIAENVFVGRLPTRNGVVDRDTINRRAEEQLQRLGLDVAPTRLVGELRVAAQQQVEIAKALTLNSKLLILDEPTAALGGDETERLFAQIRRLKAEGHGFIYISHRLDEIAQIADRIAVLRDGRLVATHETAQVPIQTLIEDMVGRSVERLFPAISPPHAREVLQVTGLTSSEGAFKNVSFSVCAGEVFGIAGIIGAGRTELVRAIAGADPLSTGTISVEGRPIAMRGPSDAIAAGIVLVPEDRKKQGLVLPHSIADNLAFGNFDLLARNGWVWPDKVRSFADDAIRRLGVKGISQQAASSLSGGNQQKVVIAKWVSRSPKIFILDEPTRGIDVAARAAIYEVIADLAKSGMAVIVVSSDLDEVLGLSHRILVLSRGRQRGILEADVANRYSVMELATT
ncbi:MAG TPA: sugar ABC transporter ATP-binding protein [Dongiaceae bacterium]|jgi:ribose transport system ATP-binding protein|nr:sugar ABC transporter ATP-binding protein [Dongiaceae bacterium]